MKHTDRWYTKTARRAACGFLAVAAVAALAGCSRAETPAADSAAAVEEGTEAAAPAAAASKIGQMSMFNGLAADGLCSAERFEGITAALAAELTFKSNFPNRIIKVGVGDSTRAFRAVNVEASMTRELGAIEETESLFASFNGDGTTKGGNRQYFTADGSARERRDLMPEEFTDASQLAGQVVEKCMPRS